MAVALLEDDGDLRGRFFLASTACSVKRGRATFTGYITDNETGLLHARARQYSPTLGRFINRDPWKNALLLKRGKKSAFIPTGYKDGFNLYGAYFVPSGNDPSGMGLFGCGQCEKEIPNPSKGFFCPSTKCVPDEEKIKDHTTKWTTCMNDAEQAYEEALRQIDAAYEATRSAIQANYDRCNSLCEYSCSFESSAFLRSVCEYTCRADCGVAHEPLLAAAMGSWVGARLGATTTWGVMQVNCNTLYPCHR